MAKGYKQDGTPIGIGNQRAKKSPEEKKVQKSVTVLPKHLKHFGNRFNTVVFELIEKQYRKETILEV